MGTLLVAAALATPWRWSASDLPSRGEFIIRLVRGSVRASVRQPGFAEINAARTAITSDPTRVDLAVRQTVDSIEIYSRYPTPGELRECLPPLDERGDFYHHDGRADLDVSLPVGWRLRVEILSCGMKTSCAAQVPGASMTFTCGGVDE